LYHSLESSKTLEKSLPLFQERDHFAYGAARTEIIAQFIEGPTETCRPLNCAKAAHWVISLFDSTVVLLQPIVEVFARSMVHIAAHCLTNGSRIGTVPVGRDRRGGMPHDSYCLFEKSLSRFHIPLLAQHGIHSIALVVDCSIQITPLSMHFEVRLIHIPGSFCLPLPLDSQLIRYQWSKPRLPVSDGLMSKRKTSRQKHLSDIA
jgi:hypothetical protein